ncbi:PREDICTED: synaptonemal complex protein 2-like [Elephantulus edwardii]|uniref:synaptonemal complex protein 2-like n=1 Tax=Elephantulus edwardii TaxID=28737 RepID=UPI0003F0DBCF|nr:PREDICTED: synaptonemal complex protein 2-like [Elephantulus edwardii]
MAVPAGQQHSVRTLRTREKEDPLPSVKKNKHEAAKDDVFWLQSLISGVLDGKDYQKIKEYFQERVCYVPQKYDHLLLPQLDKSIHKELDHHEFQCVSLLLKCIQQFFLDDFKEEEPLLIKQGLIPKMVSWFEKTRGFLTEKDVALNPALIATTDFFDTALIISKSSSKGKIQMLDSFIFCLGFLVTEQTLTHVIGQEALTTLNSILATIPREERNKCSVLEGTRLFMKDLARTLLTVGDYDQQTSISEALCRLVAKKSRHEFVHEWFEDDLIADVFKKIKDQEFETDCRQFLNQLNSSLGDQRRIYSFPCLAAFADGHELKRPENEKLEKFWIDFNLGSWSITFYIHSAKSELWESVRLFKDAVANWNTVETEKMKVLIVTLKNPIIINSKEVKKTEIHFDLQFNISQVSMKTLGEDKQILPDQRDVSSDNIAKGSASPEEDFMKLEDQCPITLPFNSQDEPASNYRKHLLSDSSQDSSTTTSESSWTSKQKRKPLRSYSNRRKKRVSSLIKLLPLSPVRTGSDEGKDKARPHTQSQKENSSPDEDLNPNILVTKSPDNPPLNTDVPDGDSVTSKLADGSTPGSLSLVAQAEDLAEGISDPSLDYLLENPDSSAFISTFESITKELKSKYELRNRKSPLLSTSGIKVPACLTKVLKQIHECRLSKLQQFNHIVLQELSHFEEDIQALGNLENDILVQACLKSC